MFIYRLDTVFHSQQYYVQNGMQSRSQRQCDHRICLVLTIIIIIIMVITTTHPQSMTTTRLLLQLLRPLNPLLTHVVNHPP